MKSNRELTLEGESGCEVDLPRVTVDGGAEKEE